MNENLILHIEDDQNDVRLLQNAFERAGIRNPVFVLKDGRQAIDYLAGFGAYADREKFPIPHLVLLDLTLPFVRGSLVLEWVRHQRALDPLKIVVITGSDCPSDIYTAYLLGTTSYIVKPFSLAELVRVATDLNKWLLKEHENVLLGPAWRLKDSVAKSSLAFA
jgi:DNA-binding response OmpR family regulator